MAIYFPRGFRSGEPLRVVNGVTVVRGSLATQRVDLVVVAGKRGALGGITGATGAHARGLLRATSPELAAQVRARPRRPGSLHVFERAPGARRWIGFLEYREVPRTAAALTDAAAVIERHAAELGVRQVALAPFGSRPAAATELVRALGERQRTRAAPLRWIVVVGDRAQLDAAIAGGTAPTSP